MLPMRRLLTAITTLTTMWLSATGISSLAQAPEPDSEATPPAAAAKVEKIGDNRYQLGDIRFNGKTREIRVPAAVNMREGILEYALVHGDGKIHESLLVTHVVPSQLQVAMKLCHYRDGEGDVFDVFYPEDEKKGPAGAKTRGEPVALTVEWQVDGEHKAAPLSDWIFDRKRNAVMPDEPWVYSGSYLYEGDFAADMDGTLIAIYLYRGAMLNTMTDGSEDDERWLANADKTPALGTAVTLVLAPVAGHEKSAQNLSQP